MYDHDAQMEREYKRQQVVEAAVAAADRLIDTKTDGSVETTNTLTLGVAIALLGVVDRGFDVTTRDLLLSDDPRRGTMIEALAVIGHALRDFRESDPVIIDWLWYEVATKFVQKVGYPIMGKLGRYEMAHPATGEGET